ncbi:MAG: DEAD/DEAH box helicase, partial [Dehalococcoidia bacterium]
MSTLDEADTNHDLLIDTERDGDAFEGGVPDYPAEDVPSFADLGISDDLIAVLERDGITSPFPVQVMTIPDALDGRDVCGKAKTGSGKTLAFGLPMVMRTERARSRRPRAIVLVPTRELANQVAEEIAPLAGARGLWLTAIYGGVSMVRQIRALRDGVEIVIATPGRLNDLLERGELVLSDIQTVVLDEADQMADMGFMPQVERILGQIDTKPQTLLFSATLDGAVGTLVRKYQDDPVRHEVVSETATVDTLSQRFIGVTRENKVEVTARICAGAARVIVFVRTKHGADRLATQLGRAGLQAAPIHGRLSQNKRERTLADFARGLAPVLVATNVAARGLHVDGVDLVVHFDPPEDEKVYLHRSGRTARAGEEGMVVTLVLPEEERDVTIIERAAGIDLRMVPMDVDDP